MNNRQNYSRVYWCMFKLYVFRQQDERYRILGWVVIDIPQIKLLLISLFVQLWHVSFAPKHLYFTTTQTFYVNNSVLWNGGWAHGLLFSQQGFCPIKFFKTWMYCPAEWHPPFTRIKRLQESFLLCDILQYNAVSWFRYRNYRLAQFAICCILRYTCVLLRVAFQERACSRYCDGEKFYHL
jgi:hypothetical protein